MSPATDQSGEESPKSDFLDQATISRRPTIVVHKAESIEASFGSTETTPEPTTNNKVPERVQGSISCSPERPKPLDAPRRPQNPVEGSFIPTTITCRLGVFFERSKVAGELPVLLHTPNSYQEIERVAEKHAETLSADTIGTKGLKFYYGNCVIVSNTGAKTRHPLRSPQDWTEVNKAVVEYWNLNINERLHLRISRRYLAFQEQPTEGKPFAKDKKLEIYDRMEKTWEKKSYIPHDVLEMVITNETIKSIIKENYPKSVPKEQKDAFIRTVQAEGRILLAMCVHLSLGMECLKKLLDSNLTDSNLPLAEKHQCHRDCRSDFENLVQAQGGYQAERFVEGEHKKLLPHAVVPLHFYPRDYGNNDLDREVFNGYGDESSNVRNKEASRCGHGAYSEVYCVKLNPNHHSLSTDLDACFALKEFKDRPKSVKSFNRELAILKELRKYSHPHIVTHLATWTQDEKYYMLFPYAQCNLREYMKKHIFAVEDASWLLEQFRGMAGAVKRIHDLSQEEAPTSSLSVVTPATEERKTGWHHDIKPENILFFKDNSSSRGMFRISDWGSAKVNTYRTRSYHTQFPIGTLTYEPPEYTYEGKTSRPYDLWSLGCVFLELLIWAVLNPMDVGQFSDQRNDKRNANSGTSSTKDDAFWQKSGNDYVLRATVVAQLERLDKALTEPDAPPFKEVVGYIRRMLETETHKRIRALELYDLLDRTSFMKTIPEENSRDVSEPVARMSLIPTNPQSPDAKVHGDSPSSRNIGPAYAENFDLSPRDMSPRVGRHSRNSSASERMPSHPTHSRQSSNASSRSTLSVRDRGGSHSSANPPRTIERGT